MSQSIQKLHALGQSLWYDNIERRLLESGEFAAMVEAGDIRGVTSNPSIFNNAIAKSNDYDDALERMAQQGMVAIEIYENLAIEDIRAAADILRPLFEESDGGDGYVSLEVNPDLANETEKTAAEAFRLWQEVDRPNLMVKIPATAEGIPAITESIRRGVNVNITLIFSQQRYVEVMEAYLRGLEGRLEDGHEIGNIASVASFFVSRIDSKVDDRLEKLVRQEGPHAALAASLRGKIAVANARLAYQRFKEIFGSERFQKLAAAGGRTQRPLWASTSTKNPSYSDVMYVEELIGPDTVNTVPPKTLEAFKDHGTAAETIENELEAARQAFKDLATVGVDFDQVTQELEEEGVESFAKAFSALIDTVEERRRNLN